MGVRRGPRRTYCQQILLVCIYNRIPTVPEVNGSNDGGAAAIPPGHTCSGAEALRSSAVMSGRRNTLYYMFETRRKHHRQGDPPVKDQRGGFSLNESHAAGRSENTRLLWTVLLIVAYVPLAGAAILFAFATSPGTIFFREADQVVDVEELRRYLAAFALDVGGMAGVIAFGGLLLAINRFDGGAQSDIDAATAMRHFMVLRFRNAVQWLAVLGTATGPLGGTIWIALHLGHDGWIRDAVGIGFACVATWTVLILAVPSDNYFGLRSVAKEWTLIHTAFRRDMLLRNWGSRWQSDLFEAPTGRRLWWHLILRWLFISLLLTGEVVVLAQLTDDVSPSWGAPGAFYTLVALYLVNAYIGGLVLLFVALSVLAGINAFNRGWKKTSVAFKGLALIFGPVVSIALMGLDYYFPFTAMAWTQAFVQVLFVLGLLNKGEPKSWVWSPVRGLVMDVRSLSHRQSHLRWRSLDRSVNASLALLPRRERKRKEKEISQWRDRINLGES
jgi:hypothetical protein